MAYLRFLDACFMSEKYIIPRNYIYLKIFGFKYVIIYSIYSFLVYTGKLKFYTAFSLLQYKGIATILNRDWPTGTKQGNVNLDRNTNSRISFAR